MLSEQFGKKDGSNLIGRDNTGFNTLIFKKNDEQKHLQKYCDEFQFRISNGFDMVREAGCESLAGVLSGKF